MRQTYRTETIVKRGITPHKLFSTAAAACLLFCTTTSVLAQTEFEGSLKSVSISDSAGTNNPPVANFTYSKAGDIVTFDASGSHDDGAITEYRWDFGDGTNATGVTTNHQFTTDNTPVTLSVVDNMGGVTLVQQDISLAPPISVAVNFQPVSANVPESFVVDSGAPYNASVGYGWTQSPSSSGTRDRNSSLSPDQSYDTFIHVAPTAVWEYKVPNGNYHVTVTVGDPVSPDTTQGVQVEGVPLINATPLSKTLRWITKDVTVEVADGNLTLAFLTSTIGKPCWVKIESL